MSASEILIIRLIGAACIAATVFGIWPRIDGSRTGRRRALWAISWSLLVIGTLTLVFATFAPRA